MTGGASLHYAGRVGTGFGDAQLATLRAQLEPLERANAPVAALPKGASLKGVHWTEPQLVAEMRYGNWTADKVLRHATFLGLREDKKRSRGCARHPIMPAPTVPAAVGKAGDRAAHSPATAAPNSKA